MRLAKPALALICAAPLAAGLAACGGSGGSGSSSSGGGASGQKISAPKAVPLTATQAQALRTCLSQHGLKAGSATANQSAAFAACGQYLPHGMPRMATGTPTPAQQAARRAALVAVVRCMGDHGYRLTIGAPKTHRPGTDAQAQLSFAEESALATAANSPTGRQAMSACQTQLKQLAPQGMNTSPNGYATTTPKK